MQFKSSIFLGPSEIDKGKLVRKTRTQSHGPTSMVVCRKTYDGDTVAGLPKAVGLCFFIVNNC